MLMNVVALLWGERKGLWLGEKGFIRAIP